MAWRMHVALVTVSRRFNCAMSSLPRLIVCVSSGTANLERRRSVRRSWFQFKHDPSSPLPPHLRECLELLFVITRPSNSSEAAAGLLAEQQQHQDILLVDAPEGYHNLWRKALVSLAVLAPRPWDYYMHADDDSYVRLDLLLPLLASAPRTRFYWGYIWDGTGNRATAPIRNPRNKSYMPEEQYAPDTYPPFASGCGFLLSRDLVEALLAQPLPDYRLLDPPFGIHLCGSAFCVVPGGPVVPVHDPRVRPYRGIPIFDHTTLVQHYLRPEEMRPFHSQVLEHLAASAASGAGSSTKGTAAAGPQTGACDEGRQQDTAHDTAQGASAESCGPHMGSSTAPNGPAAPGGHPSPAHELYAMLVDLQLLRR